MDLSFSKEDLAFRDEVRAFIAEAYTPELRARNAQTKNGYLEKADIVQWRFMPRVGSRPTGRRNMAVRAGRQRRNTSSTLR